MTNTQGQGTGTVLLRKHYTMPDHTAHSLKDKEDGGNLGLDIYRVNFDSRKISPLPRLSLRQFQFPSFADKEQG